MGKPVIDLDEGWETIQGGIDLIVGFVEAGGLKNGGLFRASVLMHHHTMVYDMCTQIPSYDRELYSRYKAFLQNYVHTKILPAVREKSGELLLREVANRWQDYNFITRRSLIIFHYLDQHYLKNHRIPTLQDTANLIFQNLIYEEVKRPIIDTVLSLINEDREGNSVDRALIKEIVEMVYGIGEKWSKPYETDFEPAFLDSSCAYYHTKMDKKLQNSEYMLRLVESLNAEKLRAMQYLHPSTVDKLLKAINLKLDIADWSDISGLRSQVERLKLEGNMN